MNTLERRLEMLDMEGDGFSRNEIVTTLSTKYKVNIRQVYRDFSTRGVWQPKVVEVKDRMKILMKAANRYERIYQKAAFKQQHAKNENVQLGALNTMLKANKDWVETLLPDLRTNINIGITPKEPFVIKKWSREDAETLKQK